MCKALGTIDLPRRPPVLAIRGGMTDRSTSGERAGFSRETTGLALGLLGVVIFGGTLPATRIALGAFSPLFITHGRAAVASLAAAILLAVLRKPFPRADALPLFVAGLLLVFGFPVLSSIAMQTVPAAHGGVVLGLLPLATSVFAALFGGERPSPLFWICGVAGAALVVTFAMRDGGMQLSSGDVLLFFAGLAASLGYVVSGRVARRMPGWEVICWALIVTAPISLPGALITYQPHYASASAAEIAAFLYLALGSMFLGFFAWNVGLAMGGIARVSQAQLLQTYVTLAISATLLGEHISAETVFFAIGVMATVMIGRWSRVSTQG
jgi:drug/metabolite transporter (DMT)-like permease